NPQIYSAVYGQSSSSMTSTGGGEAAPGLQEVLGKGWEKILALLIFPVVFFAIAYVKFMRMDIR
ncbi:MAG: ABC transporter permease subunit, partial [Methanomicrobia archaeon]|nr:ABC transporter permease subunit [Methanomicrobia archaeon]